MTDLLRGEAPKASVELPTIDQILAKHTPQSPAPVEPPAETPSVSPEPAPVPAPPKEPVADQRVLRGLETIAERERELQKEREALSTQKAELEALAKYRTFHEKLEEEDALGALDALGIRFEDLSKAVIAGTGTRPYRKVEDRLSKEIEAVKTQLSTELEQIRALQAQRLQMEFEAEAAREVSAHSPLVSLMGPMGTQAILETFQRHHQESGSAPSYKEVITEVETELMTFLKPFFESEDVRKRFVPDLVVTPTPAKTLTNQDSATLSKITPNDRPSASDRRERIDEILARAKRR